MKRIFLFLVATLWLNTTYNNIFAQQPTNTRALYEGGGKALGKFITSKFIFSKTTIQEFCYYNIFISKTGSVTKVEKTDICDGGAKDETGANEREIAAILKYCPLWKPATHSGEPVEESVSVYLKIYKNKVVAYF
jgi:hypothetical protein